jgi:hypothetical protein
MPVLADPKHEAFAQALAKGKNQSDAYVAAGYKAKGASIKVNASRLLTNANIEARVRELQAVAAKKTTDAISWEAKDIFERLQSLVDRAAADGSWKDAIDGQKFIARCFGYEDSPTLTHEHVKGKSLPQDKPEGEGGQVQQQPDRANVVMLAQAIKKAQRRAG